MPNQSMVIGKGKKCNSNNTKNKTLILFAIIQNNEDIMQSIRYKQKKIKSKQHTQK